MAHRLTRQGTSAHTRRESSDGRSARAALDDLHPGAISDHSLSAVRCVEVDSRRRSPANGRARVIGAVAQADGSTSSGTGGHVRPANPLALMVIGHPALL